jgi:hypothetical protein
MFDMLVPGTLISVLWVVLMTLLMLTIGPMIGFRYGSIPFSYFRLL